MSWLDKGADGSEDHRGGPYGLAQEGENHLRHSRCIALRDDKVAGDVRRESMQHR